MIGTRIAQYEITALLGKGGMGQVYRARDTKLKRDIALKTIPEEFSRDPDRLSRFKREAEVLASLNHPNIAAIYDLQEAEGSQFLVLELVEGETLADRIAGGPIPIGEALQIAKSICEGLEAAHEQGIIHRDLKPPNIKITADGKVKILDFGLAKAMEQLPAKTLSNSPTLLSAAASNAGMILGTAAYMSPEQAKGKTVDRRADIWAFGVVLYEMLTGRQLFCGETVSETLAFVMTKEPELDALPASTPARIRELLRRCLIKDPRNRIRDIGDVRITIGETQDRSEPNVVTPQRLPQSSSRLWMSFTAALTLIAAALAVPAVRYFRETTPATPMIRSTILPPENTTLDFTQGLGFPALSPDGRRVVFGARTAGGMTPLWVRSLDGLAAQPLAGTDGASFPFWSPDSRYIAFFATDGKLKKMDASGGPVLTIADAPNGRGGTWNRDGMIVFAPSGTNPGGLVQVPAAGGAPKSMAIPGSFPWFLPDGQHFLYREQLPQSSTSEQLRVGALDGSKGKVLGTGSNVLYSQGHILFLLQGTLMAQPFDANRLITTGEAVPVAEHVGTAFASGRVGVFSVSETGQLVYWGDTKGRTQLSWFDRSGKVLGTLGTPDANDLNLPSLSPDGRHVAVYRTVQNNTDIWVLDGDRMTRFTFDPGTDINPIWSPDGTRIVFESNRNGRRDLYWKPVSGASTEELLLESGQDKTASDWSADGRFILYYSRDPQTSTDIWVLPLQGDRKPFVFLKTNFDEYRPRFSPDGHWVAYMSNESGRFEIYVRPFLGSGGQWQISTGGGISPVWASGGKELYYIAPDGTMMSTTIAISGTTIVPGSPSALFHTHIVGGGNNTGIGREYDVTRDGRFLINTLLEDASTPPITLIQNLNPSKP